jgi:hypothetical protein
MTDSQHWIVASITVEDAPPMNWDTVHCGRIPILTTDCMGTSTGTLYGDNPIWCIDVTNSVVVFDELDVSISMCRYHTEYHMTVGTLSYYTVYDLTTKIRIVIIRHDNMNRCTVYYQLLDELGVYSMTTLHQCIRTSLSRGLLSDCTFNPGSIIRTWCRSLHMRTMVECKLIVFVESTQSRPHWKGRYVDASGKYTYLYVN